MHPHAEYMLPFAPKGKHLLAKKGINSPKLLHTLLIPAITLSIAHTRVSQMESTGGGGGGAIWAK